MARLFTRALRSVLAVVMVGGPLASTALAETAAWSPSQHLPGIVDVGVRSDGTLLAMAGGRLYQVAAAGQLSPFAAETGGYTGATPDAESYFVVAPALRVDAAGCSFTADDLFVLDLTSPPGVARVDALGRATRFVTLPGVDTLGGIALDTTGLFDHRLLVTGSHQNQTTVFAVDCLGASTTLTTAAPPLEGGLAVAPATFGQFAGALVAPDENTGQLWAIDATGQATLILAPNLPIGGDTGVESVGFVPTGFVAGGSAYLADRATPNNPFPGSDSILRLAGSDLLAAGVQAGDLLVSTEGNGTTVAVHCAASCAVIPVAEGPTGGHIEGHIAVIPDQRP